MVSSQCLGMANGINQDLAIHPAKLTIRSPKHCFPILAQISCGCEASEISTLTLTLTSTYLMNMYIFLLPTNKGIEIIDCLSLTRIEAISNYCKLYFVNGKTLVVAKVLAWFEEKLSARGFVRIHRSHLVNMQFILRVNEDGKAEVILRDHYAIPVSRRKRQQCKQAISQFYDGLVDGHPVAA